MDNDIKNISESSGGDDRKHHANLAVEEIFIDAENSREPTEDATNGNIHPENTNIPDSLDVINSNIVTEETSQPNQSADPNQMTDNSQATHASPTNSTLQDIATTSDDFKIVIDPTDDVTKPGDVKLIIGEDSVDHTFLEPLHIPHFKEI